MNAERKASPRLRPPPSPLLVAASPHSISHLYSTEFVNVPTCVFVNWHWRVAADLVASPEMQRKVPLKTNPTLWPRQTLTPLPSIDPCASLENKVAR